MQRDGGAEREPTVHVVGYGKPPMKSRFGKGRSGNPKGRPKKRKSDDSLADSLDKMLTQLITLPSGEKISLKRLAVRNLVQGAAAGDAKSLKLIMKHLERDEQENVSEFGSITFGFDDIATTGNPDWKDMVEADMAKEARYHQAIRLGQADFTKLIELELDQTVTATRKNKRVKVKMRDVIFQAFVKTAAGGDVGMLDLVIRLCPTKTLKQNFLRYTPEVHEAVRNGTDPLKEFWTPTKKDSAAN